jgi:nitrite reductase/ring-hydroxylating ferredoxin subunit
MDTGPLPIGLMFWRKQAVDRLAFDPRRSRYDRRSAIPRNFYVAFFSISRAAELRPGTMRLVEISNKKILLLHTSDGQWAVFNASCPHAGAPLEKGALCGARLICPWHKSCFATSDGAVLEPPSLESLQS